MSHAALMHSHEQTCTILWGCISHVVLYHIKQAGLQECLSFSRKINDFSRCEAGSRLSLLHPIKTRVLRVRMRESYSRKDWLTWARSFIHCCGCLICCKEIIRFPLLKACFGSNFTHLTVQKSQRQTAGSFYGGSRFPELAVWETH